MTNLNFKCIFCSVNQKWWTKPCAEDHFLFVNLSSWCPHPVGDEFNTAWIKMRFVAFEVKYKTTHLFSYHSVLCQIKLSLSIKILFKMKPFLKIMKGKKNKFLFFIFLDFLFHSGMFLIENKTIALLLSFSEFTLT